jgi:2-oxo-hept-3-ene-1,7-dioate hydratase
MSTARGLLEDFDSLGSFRFIKHSGSRILEHAYALQREFKDLRVARGERPIGFKVGCTGSTIRATLGIKESVHGYLWEGEQVANGAVLSESKFRRLGIEGELGVWLVSTRGPLEKWVVEYEPIVELHHYEFDGSSEERAFELVARNCLHAGVVHSNGRKRCLLGEIPLHEPIVVSLDGKVVEMPVLHDLELVGLHGPLATITWLVKRLQQEGMGEVLKDGDFILAATPGGIIPLNTGSSLDVEFMGLCASCRVVSSGQPALRPRL